MPGGKKRRKDYDIYSSDSSEEEVFNNRNRHSSPPYSSSTHHHNRSDDYYQTDYYGDSCYDVSKKRRRIEYSMSPPPEHRQRVYSSSRRQQQQQPDLREYLQHNRRVKKRDNFYERSRSPSPSRFFGDSRYSRPSPEVSSSWMNPHGRYRSPSPFGHRDGSRHGHRRSRSRSSSRGRYRTDRRDENTSLEPNLRRHFERKKGHFRMDRREKTPPMHYSPKCHHSDRQAADYYGSKRGTTPKIDRRLERSPSQTQSPSQRSYYWREKELFDDERTRWRNQSPPSRYHQNQLDREEGDDNNLKRASPLRSPSRSPNRVPTDFTSSTGRLRRIKEKRSKDPDQNRGRSQSPTNNQGDDIKISPSGNNALPSVVGTMMCPLCAFRCSTEKEFAQHFCDVHQTKQGSENCDERSSRSVPKAVQANSSSSNNDAFLRTEGAKAVKDTTDYINNQNASSFGGEFDNIFDSFGMNTNEEFAFGGTSASLLSQEEIITPTTVGTGGTHVSQENRDPSTTAQTSHLESEVQKDVTKKGGRKGGKSRKKSSTVKNVEENENVDQISKENCDSSSKRSTRSSAVKKKSIVEKQVLDTRECTPPMMNSTANQSSDLLQILCPICREAFDNDANMQDHLSVHVPKYSCHLCTFTCKAAEEFSAHVANVHQLEQHLRPGMVAVEDNPIRCKFNNCNNTLTFSQFKTLLNKNKLREVEVPGNGFCFISSLLIALAEQGVNKSFEFLVMEIMNEIRTHSKHYNWLSEDGSENHNGSHQNEEAIIKSCENFLQRGEYSNEYCDLCVGSAANALGINLNIIHKREKSYTLYEHDCKRYKSGVHIFLMYHKKDPNNLDAHYNCLVNGQYYTKNKEAIKSRMVSRDSSKVVEADQFWKDMEIAQQLSRGEIQAPKKSEMSSSAPKLSSSDSSNNQRSVSLLQ